MATTFQYPQFNPPGTQARTMANPLASAIPSFPQLNTAATNNISAMLSGLPSTSTARRANAFFGQQSGMPGSDFVRNRGFDLYNTQADQYQQQGFDNFLKMLAGYSGTVAPTFGQQIDQDQFAQTMDFRERQAEADRALQRAAQSRADLQAGIGRLWNTDERGNEYDITGRRVGWNNMWKFPLARGRF
jgi:parvulin-like peptidyl-prolyl isomerase